LWLAVAVQMAVLPLLAAAGWLALPEIGFDVGRVLLGGLIFGFAMAPAGGCGAGVWQHVGEGSVACTAAVAGFTASIGLIVHLAGGGGGAPVPAPIDPPRLAGLPLWTLALPLALLLLVVASRLKPSTAARGAWDWRRTGVVIGAVGIGAWALAAVDGRGHGLAIIPGNISWFEALLGAGPGRLDAAAVLVVAITLGAHAAARVEGRFKWSKASPRKLATAFAGGIGLGLGGALAAGCTVGLGLSATPLLAPGALLFVPAAMAGSWVTPLVQRLRSDDAQVSASSAAGGSS